MLEWRSAKVLTRLSRMRMRSVLLAMLLIFMASCQQQEAQSDASIIAELSSARYGGPAVNPGDGWTYYRVVPGSSPAEMWRVKHGSKPERIQLRSDCANSSVFQMLRPRSGMLFAMMECDNETRVVTIEPSTGVVTKLMRVEFDEFVDFSDTKALSGWLVKMTANGVYGLQPLVNGVPAAAPPLKLDDIVGHPIDKPCNLPCGQLNFPYVLPDGQLLLLASTDNEESWFIYSVDVERGTEHRIADGIKDPAGIVASSDGGTVFVATMQGILKVNVATGNITQMQRGDYRDISLTADGKALIVEERISKDLLRLRRFPL